MNIALASRTIPDWDSLAKEIPANVLDKGERTLRAYFQVLEAMNQESRKHVFYSFFFMMEDCFALEISTRTDLTMSIGDTSGITSMGFLSGSIYQFEQAIKLFCNSNHPKELRAFFNTIMFLLERDGVKFVTGEKLELRDGTFQWKQ